MFADPWLVKGQGSPLEFERLSYLQNKNPIHLWRAYRIARELMSAPRPIVETLPDWVFSYFDRLDSLVEDLYNRHGDGEAINIGAELAAAMGFKKKGQGIRTDAFAEDERARRDVSFAIRVRHALQDRGIDPSKAKAQDVGEAVTFVAETLKMAAAEYRDAIADDLQPRASGFISNVRKAELERLESLAAFDEWTIRRAWEKWNPFLSDAFSRRSVSS